MAVQVNLRSEIGRFGLIVRDGGSEDMQRFETAPQAVTPGNTTLFLPAGKAVLDLEGVSMHLFKPCSGTTLVYSCGVGRRGMITLPIKGGAQLLCHGIRI